jgi:calcineurin-like phosphoesterase family protein
VARVRFIGDLHFGHKNIASFSGPQRGGITNVEEHDKWIIEQWNSVCEKRDLIWVLGDVCMDRSKLPLLKKLKGNKHLILGNHDAFGLDAYKPYFNKIHGFVRYKGMWLSHAPVHPQELRGKINVHGHNHNKVIPDDRYICVSVEQVDGKPLSLEAIRERVNAGHNKVYERDMREKRNVLSIYRDSVASLAELLRVSTRPKR